MTTIQNYEYCYPNCPPQHFPPPHHLTPPPPPPHTSPPPPPHTSPPSPPPPGPPHILPPPPGHHSTVIIIIFVWLGGLFFLAFLSVALCCYIKKRRKEVVQETDIVRVDEHFKVKEAIVPGPHGPEAVILSIEEDVHFEEVAEKNEVMSKGVHRMSAEDHHPSQSLEKANSAPESQDFRIEDDKR